MWPHLLQKMPTARGAAAALTLSPGPEAVRSYRQSANKLYAVTGVKLNLVTTAAAAGLTAGAPRV